jgi:hypothetical protein
MSYCRWSSDDYQSDLYCYEDASGGWTTHVAGNRMVGRPPHEDWTLLGKGDEAAAEFWVQHTAQMAWLETAEHAPIGLAHDGETFGDPTLEAFRERLLMLRQAGYRFPDYVLEAVDAEMAEAANPT